MTDNVSFERAFCALEQAIRIAKERHNHITSNISNIDTSNYKPKDIDFKTAMEQALNSKQSVDTSRTHPAHIEVFGSSAPGIESIEEEDEWNGYNWVNIDKEMNRLTENNLIYRTGVEALLRKISTLKEIIREGGR